MTTITYPPRDATHPRIHVLVVIGTRPEAVKLVPVVVALDKDPRFTATVVTTGQHKELVSQIADAFGIQFAADLSVMKDGQTLGSLTSRLITKLDVYLGEAKPDLVIVQGDTTSTFIGALAAYYQHVPCVHIEAGLRTFNLRSPFPEEGNRRLTSVITDLHLAPTEASRANLIGEGVRRESVFVTGNTVIDALLLAVAKPIPRSGSALQHVMDCDEPVLLVTSHRRESWGTGIAEITAALRVLAERWPDWLITFPVHPNPLVRDVVTRGLRGIQNVTLLDPVPYIEFAHLMQRASIVLTDSGGVQEEAPSLGKPVLVMRDTTERPEAVAAGVARLVGTDRTTIVDAVSELINCPDVYDRMAQAVNPYGDGRAADRVVDALLWKYTSAPAPSEFVCG